MTIDLYIIALSCTVVFVLIVSIFITNPIVKFEYARKVKSDISVAEMNALETKIADFFRENHLNSDASIWKIAEALNVQDQGSVENISSRARLFAPDENGVKNVVHNKQVPYNEWLFDFAHELGHQINGDDTPADRPLGYNKPKCKRYN